MGDGTATVGRGVRPRRDAAAQDFQGLAGTPVTVVPASTSRTISQGIRIAPDADALGDARRQADQDAFADDDVAADGAGGHQAGVVADHRVMSDDGAGAHVHVTTQPAQGRQVHAVEHHATFGDLDAGPSGDPGIDHRGRPQARALGALGHRPPSLGEADRGQETGAGAAGDGLVDGAQEGNAPPQETVIARFRTVVRHPDHRPCRRTRIHKFEHAQHVGRVAPATEQHDAFRLAARPFSPGRHVHRHPFRSFRVQRITPSTAAVAASAARAVFGRPCSACPLGPST
jgi:hypothetical protein